ncbi:archease [Nanoarchaeota archaeon]
MIKMKDKPNQYKYLPHTADAKFQSFGKTLEEAFRNAFLATVAIVIDPESIKHNIEKPIEIKTNTKEALLYDFLEEIIFYLESENIIFGDVKDIKIEKVENKYKITAILVGDNDDDYEIAGNIKAITYSDMFIKEEDKVTIQVVIDL